MKKLFTLFLFCSTVMLANAQNALNENFNYGSNTDSLTGAAVAAGTWFGHSGTAPVMYLNTGLTYTGYPASGVGGSAFAQNATVSRQDVNRAIGTIYTTGSVYVSFLLNVKFGGGTSGDYFFHVNDSAGATIGGNFRGKLWLKDSTAGKISLGLTKGLSTAASAAWTAPLDTNVTYLVVLKYVFIAGTTNDSCYTYVFNSGVPSTEPVATLAATDITQTDLAKIKSVCIRQGSTGTSAETIDGIRVGSTWSDIAPVLPPLPVTNPLVGPNSQTTMNLSWTQDASYSNANLTTLVFIKPVNAVTAGTPTKGPNSYTANNVFPGGTTYQNDSLARCIYKGDGNTVSISNLSASTTYHFMVLVVRDGDSSYSTPAGASGTTNGAVPPPFPVKSLTMTFPGQVTANVAYGTDTSYKPANMSILVFMKKGTNITVGNPVKGVNAYTANSDFSIGGTKYENDSLAKCVYKGDSLKFNVTGLSPSTWYSIVAFIVRDGDSSWSAAVNYFDSTTSVFPGPASLVTFSATGQTTAKVSWAGAYGATFAKHQTIVFLKAVNPVSTAKPTKNASYYAANSNFTPGGTLNENDSLAVTVYNGDSNFVSVSGLTLGTTYHAMVYVVRITDSAWSVGATGSGSTFGATPPPAPVKTATSNNTGSTTGVVAWIKDSSYTDSSMTILVFAKKGSAIIQGTPTKSEAVYTANSDFSLNGTRYQNDTSAKCVYKGDDIKVSLTGLEASTTYHFLVYVIRNIDSAYSSDKITSFTTQAPPPLAVTGIQVKGTSMYTSTISWTKPLGYNNATTSTLVFVKESSAINAGTPTKPSSAYTASVLFGAGTKYQNDSAAFTVFKADTNFVNVSNMKRGITYHILIYTVRDADSMYSPAATGSGTVLAQPAVSTIGVISTVNPTTGVPDSLNVKVRVRGVAYGYNQRPTGLQFVLRDNTGGITLFRTTGNFGYATYAEGDSVEAEGSVATFRGLAEITMDTIIPLGTGKTLKAPTKVNTVVESGENDLLRIDSVKFISVPSGGIWPATSSNISVTNKNNDTIVLRVLNVSTLAGKPLPATPTFSIVGLGVQFSFSSAAPFAFNGYQLFPRWESDVTPVLTGDTLDHFKLLAPVTNTVLPIVSDTSVKATFSWTTAKSNAVGISAHYTIVMDTFGGNFSNPKFAINSDNGGLDTTFTIQVAAIGAALGLTPGQTYKARWVVMAQGGSFIRVADSTFVITFTKAAAPQDTLLPFALLTPTNNSAEILQGDTSADVVFNWNVSASTVTGITAKYNFLLDTAGGNFSSAKIMQFSDNTGNDTSFTINVASLSTILGLTPGMSFKAQWIVFAHGGSFIKPCNGINFVTFNRGLFNGMKDAEAETEISVYPNPASHLININSGNKTLDNAKLTDVTGRTIELPLLGTNGNYQGDVSLCVPGIYFLQLKYGTFTAKQKVVITR